MRLQRLVKVLRYFALLTLVASDSRETHHSDGSAAPPARETQSQNHVIVGKTSGFYEHAAKLDKKSAVCKLCSAATTYDGSAMNLFYSDVVSTQKLCPRTVFSCGPFVFLSFPLTAKVKHLSTGESVRLTFKFTVLKTLVHT